MTWMPPPSGDQRQSAGTHRERRRPAVARFFVDEQPPHKPLTSRQRQGTEVDTQRNPQLAPGSDACWSPGFELSIQTDWFVSDRDRSAVFVSQIETPLMFDVGLIPRDGDSHCNRDLLGSRADHAKPAAENEEFAVVHLHSIGHQDDGANGWGIEREVGLIHEVDLIGLLRSAGGCR